jgi:hypothetical protein
MVAIKQFTPLLKEEIITFKDEARILEKILTKEPRLNHIINVHGYCLLKDMTNNSQSKIY